MASKTDRGERDIKSFLADVRSAMTRQPSANPGDDDNSTPEVQQSMWRAVLRCLPRDLEYVTADDSIDQNLRCPVCLAWLLDPVQLGCPAKHMLCRTCTSGLQVSPHRSVCPLDRCPFTETPPAAPAVVTSLNQLQVRCPYSAAGCSWIGNRGDLLQHTGCCDRALEECRQCGAHVRRCERLAHVHALEVGMQVQWNGSEGVGEVVRSDLLSDTVMVRFPEGIRSCLRCELVPASWTNVRPPTAADVNEGTTAHGTLAEARHAVENTNVQRRQAEIDSVLNVYEQAERINVCFVVDCTGSMRRHIEAVKFQIFGIVREMAARLPSSMMHIAFVGYRDHGDTIRLEEFPFTTSATEFKNFVDTVGAWGCGGDVPEDVLGGLQTALNLDWSIGGAATRVLIHIGDAPCHGHYYQDRDCFTCKDNYPDGDPEGIQPGVLLHNLRAKEVQYVFGKINSTTDKMIRLFDEEAGGDYIQVREMRDTRLVAETVTNSLHASVATTVTALSAGRRAPNVVKTSEDIPIWRDVVAQDIQLHRCQQVSSISDLCTGASASATQRMCMDVATVKLAALPFSQGETRAARYALMGGSHEMVAKHMKRAAFGDEDDDDAEGAASAADDDAAVELEELLSLSEVSSVAAFLADKFSADQESGKKVRFLESHVAVPQNSGKPFNLEDGLPASEFRRFSNNIGWWEPDADELLMRFMRWTHDVTEGHMMVADLQGVRTADGFTLTDPCILCADVTRFGSGNLGPRALQRCATSLAARLDAPPKDSAWYLTPTIEASPAQWDVITGSAIAPFVPNKLKWAGGLTEEMATPPEASNTGGFLPALPTNFASKALTTALGKAGMRRSNAGTVNARPGMQEMAVDLLDVDAIIADLLVTSGGRRKTQLPSEKQVILLLRAARLSILAQPMLLELEAPLNILGDIHGQFSDLLHYFEMGKVEESSYLFLGDYVDRGKQSLEVMILLLALKVKRPENMFLLRGNHECASITRIYGFYDECKRRFNIKLWKLFCDVFNCFPAAAVIDEKIFCCHGGLSPELHHLDVVRGMSRPTDIPDTGVLCDLMWADPDKDVQGWYENDRGVSYCFGPDVAASFLAKHDLDLIVRAHQVVEDGYEFFAGRRLVTLFSAPNYCGEFDNSGALMEVRDDLECSFKLTRRVSKSHAK